MVVLQGMGWEMCAVISTFALNMSRKGSRQLPLPPSETRCLKDLPKSEDTGPPPTGFNTSSRSDCDLRITFDH